MPKVKKERKFKKRPLTKDIPSRLPTKKGFPDMFINIAHGNYLSTEKCSVPRGKIIIMLGRPGRPMYLEQLIKMWPYFYCKPFMEQLVRFNTFARDGIFKHRVVYKSGELVNDIKLHVERDDNWASFGMFKLPLSIMSPRRLNPSKNLINPLYSTTLCQFMKEAPSGIYFMFNCRGIHDPSIDVKKRESDKKILQLVQKQLDGMDIDC